MTNLGVYRERFALSGLIVFERAIDEARGRRQNYVSFGHILKALSEEDASFFDETMAELLIEPRLTGEFIDKLIESSPLYEGTGIRLSPQVIWLFRHALSIARLSGRERIEASDLVSGFVRGLKAGAPWLAERTGQRTGLAFVVDNQPHFFLVRL